MLAAALMIQGGGCAAEPDAARNAEQAAAREGCVWLVSSPAGGRVYLCGTIHILRAEDYPLASAYDTAYADASRLVFELPPGSSGGTQMITRMQELAALPKGESLDKVAGAKLADAVAEWAARHGMPADALHRWQPWFVALMITAIEYRELGAEPDKGADQYFEDRARRDKKPGEGLETVEFQLGLFARLSVDQQIDMLKQTLAEAKTLPAEYKKMIAAWQAGDLETLREMLYREAAQYPKLMDLFLHERNRTWLVTVEEMLRKGERVMVLVGAGHLAGPQGLIELLKAKGYTVEKVRGARP